MKRREFLLSSALGAAALGAGRLPGAPRPTDAADSSDEVAEQGATRKILIAGGGFGTAFIRYMASLTGKTRPKLLYLPTASADSPSGIITWFRNCSPLDVEASAFGLLDGDYPERFGVAPGLVNYLFYATPVKTAVTTFIDLPKDQTSSRREEALVLSG